MNMPLPIEKLRVWFEKEKRDFPWRQNPSPYRVWISEVMLQQTQSARVIGYFEKWMRHFPSIEKLASSSLDEVFKVWEGLGYYSRAKSLHEAAKLLVANFGGQIPQEVYELEQIKGLGPYTIGAIRAFAFHETCAAVDGNVMRVLSRLFEIDEDITQNKTQKKMRVLADSLLPEKESWVIAEAFIELGATICRPKIAECVKCPLQSACKAFQNGTQSAFPVKAKKNSYQTLFREVAVIFSQDHILLQKGEPGKVMAGLYEFPYFDCEKGGLSSLDASQRLCNEFLMKTSFERALSEVKHSFTRFRVTLYPKVFSAASRKEVSGCSWHPLKQAENLTFSSGHKKILNFLV